MLHGDKPVFRCWQGWWAYQREEECDAPHIEPAAEVVGSDWRDELDGDCGDKVHRGPEGDMVGIQGRFPCDGVLDGGVLRNEALIDDDAADDRIGVASVPRWADVSHRDIKGER